MENQATYSPKRSTAPRKRPANHESKLQTACVSWFRLQMSQYASLLFAIPNGGKRSKMTAITLKREGVTAGIPDLFLAVPRTPFSGLFIEMKFGKNKPSPEQVAMIERLKSQGYACELCYSFDEFRAIIAEYFT